MTYRNGILGGQQKVTHFFSFFFIGPAMSFLGGRLRGERPKRHRRLRIF